MFILDHVTPPYIFTPQNHHPVTPPHIPIPRKPPQTLKTPSEKHREKTPKSRNGANPDSKGAIPKYCTQKPAQIPKIPKESHKGKKPPQVSKGNSQIVKNKAIRKGSKPRKRPPTHIRGIIAEIAPIQKPSRPRKHSQKPVKTEKKPKYRDIGKTTGQESNPRPSRAKKQEGI